MKLLPDAESKAIEGEIITADEWAEKQTNSERPREEDIRRQYDDAMRNMTPEDWARRQNPYQNSYQNPQASGGLLDALFGDGFMGWPWQ